MKAIGELRREQRVDLAMGGDAAFAGKGRGGDADGVMRLAFRARASVAVSPTAKQPCSSSGAVQKACATISGPMPAGSPWVMARGLEYAEKAWEISVKSTSNPCWTSVDSY